MVFYSLLASLWCIQMYRSNTIRNAIQRTIGTVVGAVYGLIYLLIYRSSAVNESAAFWLEMGMVSLGILLVLYTTVLLDKKQASYFSCVVFLSIVINHSTDMVPYLFVWNRFLDTMIGIVIGIVINDIHICINPDKETLFISGLDDTLLDKDEVLSSFSKVELNRMIDSGMKFTVSTIRTPASLMEPMRDVRLNLPVVAMDGAVLYDVKKNEYLHTCKIKPFISEDLIRLFKLSGLCWYANVIMDDVLIIFYGDMEDETNLNMVRKLKVSPFRNYVKRELPANEDVVYFMLLDRTDIINSFELVLNSQPYAKFLRIVKYPSVDYPGYSYIKIYDKDANKENALNELKKITGLEKTVTLGTIEGQYDILIAGDDGNEVVRQVRKMYEPLLFRRKSK